MVKCEGCKCSTEYCVLCGDVFCCSSTPRNSIVFCSRLLEHCFRWVDATESHSSLGQIDSVVARSTADVEIELLRYRRYQGKQPIGNKWVGLPRCVVISSDSVVERRVNRHCCVRYNGQVKKRVVWFCVLPAGDIAHRYTGYNHGVVCVIETV